MKIIIAAALMLPVLVYACVVLKTKSAHIWLWSYIKHCAGLRKSRRDGVVDIIFCLVDHFEPKWMNPTSDKALQRVRKWVEDYPRMAQAHRDSDGKPPRHTWFFPQEEYERDYLMLLNRLCGAGYGEIELHLHHHDDTPDGFRRKILRAISDFGEHGALHTAETPSRIAFGFIHGNWALDNSHPEGKYCGVNNELQILRETGCYADFTLPSAPNPCQTRKINSIYYALDDPDAPKSHDTGRDVRVGELPDHDLMIIQGPLSLNFANRKYRVIPRIENSEISGENPATPDRIDNWISRRIHVRGKGNWIFVKVHCHGAQESSWGALLGKGASGMYEWLEENYNDGEKYRLHYVTARECYNMIKAAEAGMADNPGRYRDFLIKPYRNSSADAAGDSTDFRRRMKKQ